MKNTRSVDEILEQIRKLMRSKSSTRSLAILLGMPQPALLRLRRRSIDNWNPTTTTLLRIAERLGYEILCICKTPPPPK